MSTEQEIVEELKKRLRIDYAYDHFWREAGFDARQVVAYVTVAGVSDPSSDVLVVCAPHNDRGKLLELIRSLPVPNEPSGEDGAGGEDTAIPEGQERYALAPDGPWHWVDSETDIPWDGKSCLARASLRTVEEFPSLGTRPLPKFIIDAEDGLEPDPQHIAIANLLADAPLLAKKVTALRTALRELEDWKQAVIDALIVDGILTAEHEADPRKAIHDLQVWVSRVALDPAVSEDARKLVERAEKAEAALLRKVGPRVEVAKCCSCEELLDLKNDTGICCGKCFDMNSDGG